MGTVKDVRSIILTMTASALGVVTVRAGISHASAVLSAMVFVNVLYVGHVERVYHTVATALLLAARRAKLNVNSVVCVSINATATMTHMNTRQQ